MAFPLRQASLASVHEKNVRHGHISTLHIWPARRPLAACRAALLATLLPDPGDPEKRQALLEKIGGRVVKQQIEKKDADGKTISEEKERLEDGVLAWGRENDPSMDEFRAMIREFYGDKAPKVMDPFAGGGAIPLEAMRLGCDVTASDLNPVAWFILKCTLDYPRRFAGKQWPLPDFVKEWPDFVEDFLAGKVRRRKGNKKTHFSDPKQLLLLKLPNADLAWHVRAWGRWVLERAKADLAARYPTKNNEPTVAYLWARTGRDKMTMGRIPLLKTFWLNKKSGKRAAILPVPKEDGSGVTFALLNEAELGNPKKIIKDYSFLEKWEVSAEKLTAFLNAGTMNRAGVWSPCSGRPGLIALTRDDLKLQGQQGLLGFQMTVVVVEATMPNGKRTFKRYRLPTEGEIKAAEVEIEDLEEVFEEVPFGLPDEPIIEDAKRNTWCVNYGADVWNKLFISRQLFTNAIFIKHSRAAIEEIQRLDRKQGESIGAFLAVVLDRMIDRGSNVCTWTVSWDKIRNTFARFAIPISWDFVECVPTIVTSGGYPGQLELVAKYVEHSQKIDLVNSNVSIIQKSATSNNLDGVDVILTDPPYYDSIGYSVLMDFFYVWLRRILYNITPEIDGIFKDSLSPKWDKMANDGELVDDALRFNGDKNKSKKQYEDGMAKAFKASLDSLNENGRLVLVFANKSVDAWETLIGALIRGGAVVTASWPIQTEMPNRSRGLSSAALSSSVWIVCRKRPRTASKGWDAHVLEQMKKTLFDPRETLGGRNILQYFFDLGIRGPDFMWAALGPALESYSAHPFVKKTEGGVMSVKDFLREVRKLVLQFSLGELPGFRDVQKETRGRGEAIELDPVTQYYLLHRAYFGLKPAPAGACILYANACGKNETELKLVWNIIEQGGQSKRGRPTRAESEGADVESEGAKGNEYRLLDWTERIDNDNLGSSRSGEPAPLIDRLHRLMYLFQKNRASDVQSSFDAWGLAGENAFGPLLQAVRELAARDGQNTERRTVEALATQLKMNRKVIIEDNKVHEEPLFSDDWGNTA